MTYGLRINPDFKPYLVEGYEWGKKSRTTPYRNRRDDVVHHDDYENPETKEKVKAHEEIVKSREDKG